MKNISYWQHRLEYLVIGIAITIAASIAAFHLVKLLLQYSNWKRLHGRKLISLELTPPAFTARSSYSNDKLFDLIAGLRASRTFKDRLLMREITLPYEILSTKPEGIRFIVRLDKHYSASVARSIMTFLPEVKIAEVPSDMTLPDNAQVIEFKQRSDWFLPLAAHMLLDQHDPAAFVTSAMTQLKDKEIMGLQLIATPVRIHNAALVAHKVMTNQDLLTKASHRKSILSKLIHLLNQIMFGILDLIGEAFHSSASISYSPAQRNAYDQAQIAQRIKPARTLSKYEQELMTAVQQKVSQQLYRVSLRVMVATDSPEETKRRLNEITSSLTSYSAPPYQSLLPRTNLAFMQRYRHFSYRHRLPALLHRHSLILSASEVASLYHFPTNISNRTDNLVTSLSRTLPAPLSLKQENTMFDVVIGQNYHHGNETSIGLTADERARHVYIVGGTGNGKTTMLQYSVIQDIEMGRGVCVIDPHGDLSVNILRHIPKERVKDVIYFNPDDLDHPIGLNLLEMTPGLTGTDLMREKDRITESVISVFRKIFSEEDVGGHRIEYVLRNTILTALTIEEATIFTVLKLLQNSTYRKAMTDKLEDDVLKDFWKSELGQAGNMQRVKMSLGVTSKVSRFHSSASTKLIMEQEKSSIDFEDIINSGKILICNFPKGALGEDTSQLFGIATLAKLQLAAYRRVYMDEEERRPFYLYVDEFQNFATATFEQMLSEARKYRLFITIAEQSLAQQKDQQMIKVILANVGTSICFKTGNEEDAKVMLYKFTPFIEANDIQRLPAYNFYADLSAINSQEPVSGKTILLPDGGSKDIAQQVIDWTRSTYGKTTEIEKAVAEVKEEKLADRQKPAVPKKPKTKKKSSPKDKDNDSEEDQDNKGYPGDPGLAPVIR